MMLTFIGLLTYDVCLHIQCIKHKISYCAITNESVVFEEYPVAVQGFMEMTKHCRRI